VNLYNRTYSNITDLLRNKTVISTGAIQGSFKLNLVTNDLSLAVKDSSLIVITTPASAHEDLSFRMTEIDCFLPNIILMPGRTFGVFSFNEILSKIRNHLPIVAETVTTIYTARKINDFSVNIIKLKDKVLISAKNNIDTSALYNQLPIHLKDYLKPANSIFETSFGNVGMILHPLIMLLNVGSIDSEERGFLFYNEGISPKIAELINKLDDERLAISNKLNIKVPSIKEWLTTTYKINEKNLFELIKSIPEYSSIKAPLSLEHRYLTEDVSCGLVPFEAVAMVLQFECPTITILIDLTNLVLNRDLRFTGRNIDFVIRNNIINQSRKEQE
jgi:opine dehydrogenase